MLQQQFFNVGMLQFLKPKPQFFCTRWTVSYVWTTGEI